MSVLKKCPILLRKLSRNHRVLVVPTRNESIWGNLLMGPPDPIFGVTEAYKADKNPKKVSLGVGAYKTDDGNPYILPSVQKAEQLISKKKMNHEYLPQGGFLEFNKLAAEMAFGENACLLSNGLNVTVQALGGTGALRLGMGFLGVHFPGCKDIYMPSPTWVNHKVIAQHAGLTPKAYKYYDPETVSVDFCGMCDDIRNIPEKSIILFHAIAHNPTGLDPTLEQWKEISSICMEKKFLVFFDMAYQGFASGDLENDAATVRLFVEEGHKIILAQSFSKNMGLYGQRVGALTILACSKEEQARINSQIKIVIRGMYSNPPLHGARIVHQVLSNKPLKCQWLKELKAMAERITSTRKSLVENLKKSGSQKNWDHVIKQIGMFSYTGLTKEQVQKLIKEHSVFLTADGRISVASLGSKNVEYVAKALHAVTNCGCP